MTVTTYFKIKHVNLCLFFFTLFEPCTSLEHVSNVFYNKYRNQSVKSTMFSNETHLTNTTFNSTVLFDPCNKETTLQNIIIACFLTFVLFVGICGNSLAIFVILSSKVLQRHVAYKFIISLATADMGVSIFVTTIRLKQAISNGSFCDTLNMCYFLTFVDFLFPMASITHLMVIAIDRFCAIYTPYLYSSMFTHRKSKKIIVCAWIYVLFWASLGMFPWGSKATKLQIVYVGEGRFCYHENMNYITSVSSVIYFIPTIISTGLYCVILRVAMKQANSINKMKPSSEERSLNNKGRRRLKNDLRAARTISVVFAAYTICWMPHFITILVGNWDKHAMINFRKNHKIVYDCITTTFNNILPTINSCINPFIYFLFGANFRLAFKDVLYKIMNKPRNGLLYHDEGSFDCANDDRLSSTNRKGINEYKLDNKKI
jgi:7 transmembrane receptor (rhodopsin family).